MTCWYRFRSLLISVNEANNWFWDSCVTLGFLLDLSTSSKRKWSGARFFSGAFRLTLFSFILKPKASRGTKLCSYFNFNSLFNLWKDQLYRISGSEFYKWLFVSEKFSELSRNRPLVDLKFCLSFPSRHALEIQEVTFGKTPRLSFWVNSFKCCLGSQ